MLATLTRAAAACAVAASAITVSAAAVPASATTIQTVRTVCARDLYVRATPAGVVIGTLYYGDHFDVYRYSPSGDWVYGHAYGNVHKDGWVQNGWFC
jgi:hypothetical protein